MSSHGSREARLRAEAVAWRDRVSRDIISAAGIAAMNQCQTSIESVAEFADRISGLIAAGEAIIEVPRGSTARAAVAFLIMRGFVARIGDDLRPLRDGELI